MKQINGIFILLIIQIIFSPLCLSETAMDLQGEIKNQITNSSFEQHGTLDHQSYGFFDSIPGWQAESGKIELQDAITSGIRAYKGRTKLELDALENSLISQLIDTAIDQYYSLDLYYSPNSLESGTNTNNVEIIWNNNRIKTLSGQHKTWQYHHFDVRADSLQTRLALKATGNSDGKGGLLDVLSLTATPYTSPNLVKNPSFEQYGSFDNNQNGVYNQIQGWTASNGKILLLPHKNGGRDAAEGISKLNLNSNEINSHVEQSLLTEAGKRYLLSLSYAPQLDTQNSDNVQVFWNNTLLQTLEGNRGSWRRYLFDVIADSEESLLALYGAGAADYVGGQIDDVRVYSLPYVSENLVENGSFEQHEALQNDGNWGYFETIPGWTANPGEIQIQRLESGGILAVEGIDKLELDAEENSHVQQIIRTEVDQDYVLNFSYTQRHHIEPADSGDVEVWWDEQLLVSLSGIERNWENYRYTVMATSENTLLEFRGVGTSDGQGGHIDNVRLYQLPALTPAPEFTSTPITTATQQILYEYDSTAIDPQAETLSYSLTQAPAGMTIDSASGVISWFPTISEIVQVIIEVQNPQGQTDTQNFQITVFPINHAPVISSIPLTSAIVGIAYQYPVIATDIDNNSLTYNLVISPPGMLIDNQTGIIQWTAQTPGAYNVTIWVTDPQGAKAIQTYSITVLAPNQSPQITSTAPTTALENSLYSYQINANDPDGDLISYALTLAPQGMTIDVNSGLVQWQPNSGGQYDVTIIVTDSQGANATQNFQIQVANAAHAPIITSQPPTAVIIEQLYQYQIIATDPDNDTLTYQLLAAPVGMQINSQTGLIQWTPVSIAVTNVNVRVVDLSGLSVEQNFAITVNYTSNDQPPILQTIGDQIINLGSPFKLQLSATDPLGQAITYRVTPLPLPANASLNSQTGEFIFNPKAAQAGTHTLTFSASDGKFTSTETVNITVPQADSAAPTRFIGQVLDATAKAQGVDIPIVGSTISFIGTGISTTTDANGNFIVDNIPDGLFTFSIDNSTAQAAPGGAGYASFHVSKSIIAHVDNYAPKAFTLPRLNLGSQTQINPTKTAVIDNSEIAVSMTVAAGTAVNSDGSQFTGKLSISEVPPNFAPGSLPREFKPGMLVTIQPLGVRFTTPAPITFPNTDQIEPGTETELWSLNPDTGKFDLVGMGRVSSDAQRIETISGGVRQSDWYFPVLPIPSEVEPLKDQYNAQCNACTEPLGSSVSLSDGRLNNKVTIPAYHSLGENRQISFNYQSQRSGGDASQSYLYPYRVKYLKIEFENVVALPFPPPMSVSYTLGGINNPDITYFDLSKISDGQWIRSSVNIDIKGLTTGIYPFELRHTVKFRGSEFSAILQQSITVVNEVNSAYGAGWMLEGIDKLITNQAGEVFLISSKDDVVHYIKDPITGIFTAPDASFTQMVENQDGTYTLTDKYGINQQFDAQGKQIAHTDRNQNTTTYQYFGNKLDQIIDPVGQITQLSYKSGYLSHLTDPSGRITRLTHNSNGDLIAIAYPDGTIEQFEYQNHSMTAKIDELGNRTDYTYDRFGRLIDATLPDQTNRAAFNNGSIGIPDPKTGQGTQLTPFPAIDDNSEDSTTKYRDGRGNISQTRLDKHGRPIYKKDAINRITTTQRDKDSNPTQIIRPNTSKVNQTFDNLGNVLTRTENFNNATTRYTRNQFSQITAYTNQNNHTTTINRDSKGNPTLITNHLGHQTQLTYDNQGLVTQSISSNGLISDYTYNPQGLLDSLTETPPAASQGNTRISGYQYNNEGLISQITTPDQIIISYQYDPRNRITQISDQLGQSLTYIYDVHGNNITSQTENADSTLALTVSQEYDKRNRLTKIIQPHTASLDSETQLTLDRNSNLQAQQDPRQNSSNNSYDPVDRLQTQTHRLGGITSYEYDTQDRITKVTAPNGVITTYTYDLLGRKLSETSPDRGTIQYSYDKANNIIQMIDGRGISTDYQYDELERIISKTLPTSTENVTYSYDTCAFGIGKLCQVNDESGQTNYKYDAFGNLVEKIHTELNIQYTTKYSYDEGDHLIAMTLPSGRKIIYSRDGIRRVVSINAIINGNNTPLLTNIQYRADYRMTQCTFGNGLTDQRSYDLQGRLTDQNLTDTNNNSIDQRHYDYDANGNLIDHQIPTQNSQYQYDPLDRLINDAIQNQDTIQYGYDLNDNRQQTATNTQSQDYHYQNSNNRISDIEINQFGNQALAPQNPRQLHYNDVGRLHQLLENNALIATYTYNAYGQRTRKVTNQSTIVYHYDQAGMLISETQADGTPIRDYIRSDGTLVAQIDNNGNEQIRYLHTDHLNTAKIATNEQGTLIWRWQGDGFGKTKPELDPDQNGQDTIINLRFPGQYFDFESGWFYNYFRYYDPSTGRYITSDPIGLAGGLNTYLYANANPNRYIDPTGKIAIADDIVIGGGIILIGGCIATNCTEPLIDLVENIVDTVSDVIQECKNDDNKCDLEFVRETPSYDGITKSCLYKRKALIFTFPQAVGYECPPIDKEKCLVDTSKIMPPARY